MEVEDDIFFVDEYDHVIPSLIYSPTSVPGTGADLSELESQLCGCRCSDDDVCLVSSNCQTSHVCKQNYSSSKTLLEEKWSSGGVVECNSQCNCSVTKCCNRIVQFGPRKNLEIFMASPVKGYGLRTLELIPKGAFICEYAGEVIGLDEARNRFQAGHISNKMNYIFVLRELIDSVDNSSVIQTIIDPSFIGNIGRYINHSCDPNSGIVPVRIDSPLPKLGIFAKHNIFPGDEITYDYNGGLVESKSDATASIDRKPCSCKAKICRGSLPFDQSLI